MSAYAITMLCAAGYVLVPLLACALLRGARDG